MTRKLDFVVFGLPRGGTTAVANYISAVPSLHCGVEVFPTYLDHATLPIPEAFITAQHEMWNSSSAEEVRTRGHEISHFGNKTPTYFYRLPSLLEELDNCPAIACVRDLREVATSYSKRATDPGDPWAPGRSGLFAMGDALLLLHALHSAPKGSKVMILPQNVLLADWRAAMTRAVAHIAPGVAAEFDETRLKKIDKIKRQTMAKEKPVLELPEKRALNRLKRDGLVDFFARPDIMMLDDVRDEIATILAQTPPNPINFIRRQVADHPNPAVTKHFEGWSRQAARAGKLYGLKGRSAAEASADSL